MAAPTAAPSSLEQSICKKLIAKGVKPNVARMMAARAAARARKAKAPTDAKMSRTGSVVELGHVPTRLRAKARQEAAEEGYALPDGSWPIRNRAELGDALRSWGRAVHAGNAATVKAHILKRAKALGVGADVIARIEQLNTGGAKEMGRPKGEASLELASWNPLKHPRFGKGKKGGEFRSVDTDSLDLNDPHEPTRGLTIGGTRLSVNAPSQSRLTRVKEGPGRISHEETKRQLASYIDAHPEDFTRGTYVSHVVNHKGEHRLAKAGSILALAGTLAGFTGGLADDEDRLEPPDPGPTAQEVYEQFHAPLEKDSVVQLMKRRSGPGALAKLSNEMSQDMGKAHPVVARVKGTPVVRLEKNWADMEPAERDAFLESVVSGKPAKPKARRRRGGKR